MEGQRRDAAREVDAATGGGEMSLYLEFPPHGPIWDITRDGSAGLRRSIRRDGPYPYTAIRPETGRDTTKATASSAATANDFLAEHWNGGMGRDGDEAAGQG
jgi:hypothetical protein